MKLTYNNGRIGAIGVGFQFAYDARKAKREVTNGLALKHHIDAVHNGQISDSCRACKEIQQKANRLVLEHGN